MQNIGGSQVFDYAVYAYFAAYLCYLGVAFFRNKVVGWLATGLLAAGWVTHTVFLVERVQWYYQQHQTFVLPSTNMFEVIGYFAWLIVLAYLIAENFFLKTRAFGFLCLVVPLAAVAYASQGMAPDPRELVPSLKSYWLKYHITAMITSYALFALSASFAVAYVLVSRGFRGLDRIDKRFNLKFLDETSYKLVLVAFPVLTLGIGLGAVWAHDAWGRYWGWDPKEVWALITWLVYLSYLHFRVQMSWLGYRSALLNIIGFGAVLITFQGVNMLDSIFKLNSIHAYATGTAGPFFLCALGLIVLIPVIMLMLPKPNDDLQQFEQEWRESLRQKQQRDAGGPAAGDSSNLRPAKPHAKADPAEDDGRGGR
jgi:cytochrome c-type biogenesis protein CcsB